MKTLVEEYKFDKANKQITFTGILVPSALEEILLITNVTTGDILYSFADKLRGGSLSKNVLTLIFDTTKMNDTDRLQIFIESDQYQTMVAEFLRAMLKTVNFSRDSADRMRIVMDNNPMLYTYTRNSGTSLAGSQEGWYSPSSWNTVDAREQLMALQNSLLNSRMQRWEIL
jgi:hypothetical protein